MKDWQDKSKLLGELEKMPVVHYACTKTGISRSTFYRWMIEDEKFKKKAKRSLSKGIDSINDVAESKLIKKVYGGEMRAITFWLKARHKSYKAKRKKIVLQASLPTVEPLPEKPKKPTKRQIKKERKFKRRLIMAAHGILDNFMKERDKEREERWNKNPYTYKTNPP